MSRSPVNQSFNPDELYTPPVVDKKQTAMKKIFQGIPGIGQVKEVLPEVKAVPTRFVSFDFATRVGGMPIERVTVVHGPSSHGKTVFCHGVGLSFLEREHMYHLIDAEYTTPIGWLTDLFGGYTDSPYFTAMRPKSYEQTVLSTRMYLDGIIKGKREGIIDSETSSLIVVDSIRKLIPEGILDKLQAEIKSAVMKNGVDGYKGRAAMIKAALNASWLDELVPMLAEAGAAMIIIARESQNTSTDLFKTDWKMTGGNALEFDSSLIIRIERDEWIKSGSGDDAVVIGEKHRLTIRKTKVGGKDGKNTRAYFHTSNGVLTPAGFDVARDLVEMGLKFGIISKSGSHYAFDNQSFKGMNNICETVSSNNALFSSLEQAIRQQFRDREPERSDDEE